MNNKRNQIEIDIQQALFQSDGIITDEIKELYKQLDNVNTASLEWKIKKYSELMLKIDFLDKKVKSLKSSLDSAKKSLEWWDGLIKSDMKNLELETFSTDLYDLSFRESKRLIVDEDRINEIPEQYKDLITTTTTKIDKKTLKSDLEKGVVAIDPGVAKVETFKNIQIK